MKYEKFNANPLGKKTNDCVIRTLSKATGKSWEVVFEELIHIARELKTSQTDISVSMKYLEGKEKINVFKFVNTKKKRLSVSDVCDLKGSYVVQVAGHFVAVVEGKYYDIWDCGKKCAYRIWRV
jgi:hypothetical protein